MAVIVLAGKLESEKLRKKTKMKVVTWLNFYVNFGPFIHCFHFIYARNYNVMRVEWLKEVFCWYQIRSPS